MSARTWPQLDQSFKTGLTNLRDASSVTTAAQQRHLETLKEELEAARTSLHDQARTMSAQAKAEATARAEQLARQIEAEQAKVQQQVSSEISDVKQSATAANAKIADVSTDVGNVKTQVSATQAELQKTIADLKSARAIWACRAAWSPPMARNWPPSSASASATTSTSSSARPSSRNVSAISRCCSRMPTSRRTGTRVQVMADDKLTEKKDKSINEPVQFYTTKGGRLPYELVINQVAEERDRRLPLHPQGNSRKITINP